MDDNKKGRLETLIEKFISDIQEEYQQVAEKKEDGTRMLTVSAMSPPSHFDSDIDKKMPTASEISIPDTVHSDIDKKIADLENLIKRLQSEITNISLKSQKSHEGILNLKDLNDDKKSGDDEEDCSSLNDCSPKKINVTPSPISVESDLPLKEASKKFDEAISQLINVTEQMDSVAPSTNDVKSDIITSLFTEQEQKETFRDGLEELIDVLKSEINSKMDEANEPRSFPCENKDNE